MPAPRNTVSLDEIKDRLLARLDTVVHRYAPPVAGSYTKNGKYFTLNPGRFDRSVGSFWVNMSGPDAGRWADAAMPPRAGSWAQYATGDILDLIQMSLALPDAAQAIAEARAFLGLATESPELRRAREAAAAKAKARRAEEARLKAAKAKSRAKAAQAIWLSAEAQIRGTPVDHYLRGRGLDLSAIGRQPRALRYQPECLYLDEAVDPETGEVTTTRAKLPAMVAAISDGRGNHIATHRTYLALSPQGKWVKAPVRSPKMVLGDYRGGSIRLSSGVGAKGGKGARLNDCPPGSRVYIAEGIETALSALVMRPGIRVLAAVSLSGMAAVELPANVAEVVLITDGDEHEQAQRALQAAVEAHAKAGRTVRIWASDVPGEDLNDALQRVLRENRGAA